MQRVEEQCPICLEQLQVRVGTSCGHIFCTKCLWSYCKSEQKKHNRPPPCPLCRTPLVSFNIMYNQARFFIFAFEFISFYLHWLRKSIYLFLQIHNLSDKVYSRFFFFTMTLFVITFFSLSIKYIIYN